MPSFPNWGIDSERCGPLTGWTLKEAAGFALTKVDCRTEQKKDEKGIPDIPKHFWNQQFFPSLKLDIFRLRRTNAVWCKIEDATLWQHDQVGQLFEIQFSLRCVLYLPQLITSAVKENLMQTQPYSSIEHSHAATSSHNSLRGDPWNIWRYDNRIVISWGCPMLSLFHSVDLVLLLQPTRACCFGSSMSGEVSWWSHMPRCRWSLARARDSMPKAPGTLWHVWCSQNFEHDLWQHLMILIDVDDVDIFRCLIEPVNQLSKSLRGALGRPHAAWGEGPQLPVGIVLCFLKRNKLVLLW